jgi:polysaccharide deacetylase 2 family uncharacterized protein YibQ
MAKRKTKSKKSRKTNSQTILISLLLSSIMLLLIVILFMMPMTVRQITGIHKLPTPDKKQNNQTDHENSSEKHKPQIKSPTVSEKQTSEVVLSRHLPIAHPERDERGKGYLSVVIDDVGNNVEELKPFLLFPGRLTFAVLPMLRYSTVSSHLIKEAGKEVFLHLPMEAIGGNDPGPGVIKSTDGPETIAVTMASDLASVPDADGINNHMGSKTTTDENTMTAVLRFVKEKNLLFLDSRTTPDTKAAYIGKIMDMKILERNIFLDNVTTKEAVVEEFNRGIKIAETNGSAVLIGHLQNKVVLEVLWEFLPLFDKKEYTLLTLKELTGERIKREDIRN